MKKIIFFFFLLSSPCLAICEQERAERDEFRDLCYGLASASGITASIGGPIASGIGGFWWGVGVGVGGGLAFGLPASNQCRIYKEKISNVERCEADYAEAQRQALLKAEKESETLPKRNQLVSQYALKEKVLRGQHKKALKDLFLEMMQEGKDPTDPEFVQKTSELDSHYESLIKQLKVDLDAEIAKL